MSQLQIRGPSVPTGTKPLKCTPLHSLQICSFHHISSNLLAVLGGSTIWKLRFITGESLVLAMNTWAARVSDSEVATVKLILNSAVIVRFEIFLQQADADILT